MWRLWLDVAEKGGTEDAPHYSINPGMLGEARAHGHPSYRGEEPADVFEAMLTIRREMNIDSMELLRRL
jgi:hypothetical protein